MYSSVQDPRDACMITTQEMDAVNTFHLVDFDYQDGPSFSSNSSGSATAVSKLCTPRTLLLVDSLKYGDAGDSFAGMANPAQTPNIWSVEYKGPVESLVSPISPFGASSVSSWSGASASTFNSFHRRFSSTSSVSPFDPAMRLATPNAAKMEIQQPLPSIDAYWTQNFDTPMESPQELGLGISTNLQFSYPPPSLPTSPTTHFDCNQASFEPKIRKNHLTFKSYRGTTFAVPSVSRFFVIKSYSILDVNASFTHNIWTSTELGNKRLSKAYKEAASNDGKIFLLFSVNASGKFCGVAEMSCDIDFTKSSEIWVEQQRWKGIFPVEWLLIKDVPNKYFQHLKVPANENKSVTNSRDTQEIPYDVGLSMLKIISYFKTN